LIELAIRGLIFVDTANSYMVCRREACGKYVGFVRLAGTCVVVTDDPYWQARKFMSEVAARSKCCELNNMTHSSGNLE
jgi:hypothetical protein